MNERQLTKKQKIAVNYLKYHPRTTVDEMLDKAGVSPAFSNQAEFIMRLLQRGAVRLTVVDEEPSVNPADHVTPSNPTGAVLQCHRRDLHAGHEYQPEFGAYFNYYCPGNDGTER